MSERLVPVLRRDWGFFDRQRSLFSESHKDFDDEFKRFEDELEQMKRDMFTLTPLDFGSMGLDFDMDMGRKMDMDMDMSSMDMSRKMNMDMSGMDMGRKMDMSGMDMGRKMDMSGMDMGRKMDMDLGLKMDSSKKTESSIKQTTSKTASSKTSSTAASSNTSSTTGAIQPANSIVLTVQRPFITDIEGNKKLTLRFDVSKFKPEEITVKTIDKTLTVNAKHVEESPGKKIYREFTKTYTLPKPVDPLLLTSTLSKDGVLHIEAPTPTAIEAPREYLIPITKM